MTARSKNNHKAPPYRSGRPVALLGVLAALALPLAGCGGGGTPASAHISGTAYKFNKPFTRIANATIRVAENPLLTAQTDANGNYTLEVPASSPATLYIEASGYSTVYSQTFTPEGDIARVNFQTPDLATYNGLYGLLTQIGAGVAPDANGCVIVSTVSVPAIRELSIEQFLSFGAHGYAGAQANIEPAGGKRTYFNASVLPDPRETATTKDGGVVWTNVPPGRYTLSASDPAKPTQQFATVKVDCQKGRVINANPPQGLVGL
jgi:hypothetical protein